MTLTAYHRPFAQLLVAALAAFVVFDNQVEISRIVGIAVAFGTFAVLGSFVFKKLFALVNMVTGSTIERRHLIMVLMVENGGRPNTLFEPAVIDHNNVFLGNRNAAENHQYSKYSHRVEKSKAFSH